MSCKIEKLIHPTITVSGIIKTLFFIIPSPKLQIIIDKGCKTADHKEIKKDIIADRIFTNKSKFIINTQDKKGYQPDQSPANRREYLSKILFYFFIPPSFCFHISSLLARSQTLVKTARTKNRLG